PGGAALRLQHTPPSARAPSASSPSSRAAWSRCAGARPARAPQHRRVPIVPGGRGSPSSTTTRRQHGRRRGPGAAHGAPRRVREVPDAAVPAPHPGGAHGRPPHAHLRHRGRRPGAPVPDPRRGRERVRLARLVLGHGGAAAVGAAARGRLLGRLPHAGPGHQRLAALRELGVRLDVLHVQPLHRVGPGVRPALDGRRGAGRLHVRRVRRGADSRRGGGFRSRVLDAARRPLLLRRLRLGRRLHHRLRAHHGAGGALQAHGLRHHLPGLLRRRRDARRVLGLLHPGAGAAAGGVRPARPPARRPLVADRRVPPLAVVPGPRHRGRHHRGEGRARQRRRGHRHGALRVQGQVPRAAARGRGVRHLGPVPHAQHARQDAQLLPQLVRQQSLLLRAVVEHGQAGRRPLHHPVPGGPGGDPQLRGDHPAHGPHGPPLTHQRHDDPRRRRHPGRRLHPPDDVGRQRFRHDSGDDWQVHDCGVVCHHLQLHGRAVPHPRAQHGPGGGLHVRASVWCAHTPHHVTGLSGQNPPNCDICNHSCDFWIALTPSARDPKSTHASVYGGWRAVWKG
ncbi:hypothetical protein FOCC_FOCC008231, partial [Frankliniella occidentalis]